MSQHAHCDGNFREEFGIERDGVAELFFSPFLWSVEKTRGGGGGGGGAGFCFLGWVGGGGGGFFLKTPPAAPQK